jgi:hypothetical protein
VSLLIVSFSFATSVATDGAGAAVDDAGAGIGFGGLGGSCGDAGGTIDAADSAHHSTNASIAAAITLIKPSMVALHRPPRAQQLM